METQAPWSLSLSEENLLAWWLSLGREQSQDLRSASAPLGASTLHKDTDFSNTEPLLALSGFQGHRGSCRFEDTWLALWLRT